MSNHIVGIDETSLLDHIKKRMPRVGDSLRTTKPSLRDHAKSCPNDRNDNTGLWMPGIQKRFFYWTPISTGSSTSQITTACSTRPAAWLVLLLSLFLLFLLEPTFTSNSLNLHPKSNLLHTKANFTSCTVTHLLKLQTSTSIKVQHLEWYKQ